MTSRTAAIIIATLIAWWNSPADRWDFVIGVGLITIAVTTALILIAGVGT